jgi:tetratricopeptide (TPR) repeat protein
MRRIIPLVLAIAAITTCGGTANSAPDLQQKILLLTTEARSAYSNKQFDIAEQKYNQAITLTASAAPKIRIALLSNLGAAYREDHKYVEAESTFKKALAISDASHLSYDASSKLTMQQYAMLLRKLKRIAEADALEIRSSTGVVAAYSHSSTPASGFVSAVAAPSTVSSSPIKSTEVKIEDQAGLSEKKASVEELKAKLIKEPQSWILWARLGSAQARADEWKEAAQSFKTALSNASSTKQEQQNQLRLAMVASYMRDGDTDSGMEPCKRLYADNPDNATVNRLMSGFYSLVGDWSSQLAVDEQFVQKFPTHRDVEQVTEGISRLKNDLNDKATASQKTDNKPTNEELKYSFVRASMPLKVYVAQRDDDSLTLEQGSTTAVTENTPGQLIQHSMDAWTEATQGRVRFVLTDKPEAANITCDFTADPSGLESSTAAGLTTWTRTTGGRMQAVIHLLTVSPHSAKPIERGDFLNAAMHEFGHALGLLHSDRIDDIMYRRQGATPIVQLSDNDRDRILKLYTAF